MITDLQHHLSTSHVKFADLADREIVERAQRGDESASEFLLYKYRNLVRTKVKSYFLVGAEKEDLLQVGMIGLWQAIVDFRCDKAIFLRVSHYYCNKNGYPSKADAVKHLSLARKPL